jgi:hypothetical protein
MHAEHQPRLLEYDIQPQQVVQEGYQPLINDFLQVEVKQLAPKIYQTLPGNQLPYTFNTTGVQ